MVKNLPAMWQTQGGSLGREDPLEKEIETHSSILTWRIPGTEEPGGLQVHNVTKSQTRLKQLTFSLFTFITFKTRYTIYPVLTSLDEVKIIII